MTLELQKYLDIYTPDKLKEEYGINYKRHKQYPNLVQFKYNQITSPMHEKIVQEARGIILDEDNYWCVVCRGFDKFFNYGEPNAAEIDWESADVYEKLDGSLCQLYYWGDKWHVATSGTPDASGDINGNGNFAEYFWEVFAKMEGRLPHKDFFPGMANFTFMLELCGNRNRVVVVHNEDYLRVIGCRNNETMQEYPAGFGSYVLGIPEAQSFDLDSIQELMDSFSQISPLSQEGYVVVDKYYNRIKVKHPGYVALHHAVDGLNDKALLEIARKGETSEVLTAFPELMTRFQDVQRKLECLEILINATYDRFKGEKNQKQFAEFALRTYFSSCLFQMRAKGISAKQFLSEMPVDKLKDWMEKVP